MEIDSTTTTTTRRTIKIDEKVIESILRGSGIILDHESIDSIEFEVPSGGDYSGMSVDVDEDSPVKICVTSVTNS